MKDVALITLHGMGKLKTSYYSELEDELKRELGNKWPKVSFQTVQYGNILQEPEDALWQLMRNTAENKLAQPAWREFFLFGFGDAASLEHSAQTDKVQYLAVQREIQLALDKILIDFDGDTNKPVVIIAHSLGCQVLSNYLWDAKEAINIFAHTSSATPEQLEFRKLKSLTNLVTTGCNIPIFVSGIKDRHCFQKPNDAFVWDNYYDKNDLLGWPLKQLGSSYDFIRDHEIKAGTVLTSWNPGVHGGYWNDRDVFSPLASILRTKLS